jgi:hypothetical protein
MPTVRLSRPTPSEYPAAEYSELVASIREDEPWLALESQPGEVERLLGSLPEERLLYRYAPGKWSVKEVLGHLCDSDRVFSYRALRFGRDDPTPLHNFDEGLYARTGRFDARPIADLLAEFRAARAATLALFRSFDAEALTRTGVARGLRVSVRAIAWVTAGHARHHLGVLRERYGLG